MLFQAVNSPSDINATDYFHTVLVTEHILSEAKIKTMLSAAILRYIGGLTSIQFVLELYTAINRETNITTNGEFLKVNLLFAHIEHQIIFEKNNNDSIESKLETILQALK